ncbi:MAG: DegT/DnrJ/EryC1/StrS family aminotransferase, partial [Syntrophaceae bacterium]|nr:DegT/DnrJ/EryC1/StrS family aminotransferase [Syntrophaceae bacterium]
SWLQHERLGFNYRMSDINCALGIAQLERIEEMLAKREKVATTYNERLKDVEGLILPHFEENKKISWFVYVIRLVDRFSQEDRDMVLRRLKEKGIGCSNYFPPIHIQPFYRDMFGYKKRNFPVTERVSERTVALPFYNYIKEEAIDYVCENLKRILKEIG